MPSVSDLNRPTLQGRRIVMGVDTDHYYFSYNGEWDDRTKCYSKEHVTEVLESITTVDQLMFSSSIDYPEESTNEAWIIEGCRRLRELKAG